MVAVVVANLTSDFATGPCGATGVTADLWEPGSFRAATNMPPSLKILSSEFSRFLSLVESPADMKIAAFGKLSMKLENYIHERKFLPIGDSDRRQEFLNSLRRTK